jgi:hypothetical protein
MIRQDTALTIAHSPLPPVFKPEHLNNAVSSRRTDANGLYARQQSNVVSRPSAVCETQCFEFAEKNPSD